jgi:hypothetical protein
MRLPRLTRFRKIRHVKKKAEDIEGALDLYRNYNAPTRHDDDGLDFCKVGSGPLSCQTPEQRVDALDNVLKCRRSKGVDGCFNDPTKEFRRLDAIIPTKKSQERTVPMRWKGSSTGCEKAVGVVV